jgi:Icc-related predicted phosphoesterase
MGMITIAALSDLHGYLPEVPDCELLLLGGDLCPDGRERDQAQWLDSTFRLWLRNVPAKEVVAVAGNHDWVFQTRPELVPMLRWHYLLDSAVTLFGMKIWGTPWQPVFFDWAFNLWEPELEKKWALIPNDTDILLLHGPPFGCGDRTVRGNQTGSPSLTRRIEEIQPRLAVCGHIHEGRGEYRIGLTKVVNVSQVDVRYEPVKDVWVTTMEV